MLCISMLPQFVYMSTRPASKCDVHPVASISTTKVYALPVVECGGASRVEADEVILVWLGALVPQGVIHNRPSWLLPAGQ